MIDKLKAIAAHLESLDSGSGEAKTIREAIALLEAVPSVSLEKCAAAVAVELGEPHEDDICIAKAVLDAAGVKYTQPTPTTQKDGGE